MLTVLLKCLTLINIGVRSGIYGSGNEFLRVGCELISLLGLDSIKFIFNGVSSKQLFIGFSA